MSVSDITRRGILNQGALFSPYRLFDLLACQHADELDPEGREANRPLLRRLFRAVRPSARHYFEFRPICPAHYRPDGSSRHQRFTHPRVSQFPNLPIYQLPNSPACGMISLHDIG